MDEKRTMVKRLIEESRTSRDYYLLMVISTMISTMGLVLGNASVVIGGMLISPLLTPLLSLGLSIITNNRDALFRSLRAIGKSLAVVLGVSFVTAFVVGLNYNLVNTEIISRAKPSLLYLYIAILSGIGATYAWVRPKISASLPGIAVAIALVPPLSVVGIGMAQFDRAVAMGALQMFIINVIGIVGSSTVLFSLFGFHDMRGEEERMIAEEKVADIVAKAQAAPRPIIEESPVQTQQTQPQTTPKVG